MFDFINKGPIVKKYYENLDEGKLTGFYCNSCGKYHWPPYPVCSECGSYDLDWTELSGEATIFEAVPVSKSELNNVGDLAMAQLELWPFWRCCGQLKEGPAFNAMVFGFPEDATIEELNAMLPVKAKVEFIQLDGFKTTAFRVVEE